MEQPQSNQSGPRFDQKKVINILPAATLVPALTAVLLALSSQEVNAQHCANIRTYNWSTGQHSVRPFCYDSAPMEGVRYSDVPNSPCNIVTLITVEDDGKIRVHCAQKNWEGEDIYRSVPPEKLFIPIYPVNN